jgi:hypothetical protein
MLFLKYTMLMAGLAMFVISAVVAAQDLFPETTPACVLNGHAGDDPKAQPHRWRTTLALGCLAWAPVLMGMSVLVKG